MTSASLLSRALLLAFGCLSAFAASGDIPNLPADANKPHSERSDRSFKRYRNPGLGYCVSYPSRWLKSDAFEGAGLFVETGLHRHSKPTGEIDIGPMIEPRPEDARIKPASIASDELDQDLREHLAGLRKFARAEKMEVIEQHPFKVQGFSALYVKNRYYDPLERSTWMQEVVFVKRNSDLYRIELQCPPDQIPRFEQVFSHMVDTLDFGCSK